MGQVGTIEVGEVWKARSPEWGAAWSEEARPPREAGWLEGVWVSLLRVEGALTGCKWGDGQRGAVLYKAPAGGWVESEQGALGWGHLEEKIKTHGDHWAGSVQRTEDVGSLRWPATPDPLMCGCQKRSRFGENPEFDLDVWSSLQMTKPERNTASFGRERRMSGQLV